MGKIHEGRVLHLTLHKCGSQWVRDVLTARELRSYGGLPNSGITLSLNVLATPELDVPDGTFAGPIYRMNQWEWTAWKSNNDRALVVLRDPRDRLVSEIYSVLYSHRKERFVEEQRRAMATGYSIEEHIGRQIPSFGALLRCYVTWMNCTDSDAFILRYEDLINDQLGSFEKVLQWLGWKVPEDILSEVVERHSFKAQTGREPGEVDIYSHHRKGLSGDWRNHFLRSHGKTWERLFPGVLRSIGYETSNDWWRSLPEKSA